MKICQSIILLLILIAFHGHRVDADYYDGIVTNRDGALSYLAEIERAVGREALSQVRSEYAMSLAERLGQIDRLHLKPEHFVRHVRDTQDVEAAFFSDLTFDQIRDYLLPYRIAYELAGNPIWKSTLRQRISKLLEGTEDRKAAVEKILRWIGETHTNTSTTDTYSVAFRGWQDPVSTDRGKRGTEPDIAVLAVGALRSIGIPARIVFTHAVVGGEGGKVWMEYWTEQKLWTPWVPSFGTAEDHRAELSTRYKGRMPLILANPDNPIPITRDYFPEGRYIIGTSGDSLAFFPSVAVRGQRRLFSTIGEDFNSNPYAIGANLLGAAPVVVVNGNSKRCFGIQEVTLSRDRSIWGLLNVESGTQKITLSENAPEGFEASRSPNLREARAR